MKKYIIFLGEIPGGMYELEIALLIAADIAEREARDGHPRGRYSVVDW